MFGVGKELFLAGKNFGYEFGGDLADVSYAKGKYEPPHGYASARIDRSNKIAGRKLAKAL